MTRFRLRRVGIPSARFFGFLFELWGVNRSRAAQHTVKSPLLARAARCGHPSASDQVTLGARIGGLDLSFCDGSIEQ